MRSVRLDPELDQLVKRAAAREGATVSEFVRCAAADRARQTLQAHDRLDGVIGAVRTEGGSARRTGAAFGELLRRHALTLAELDLALTLRCAELMER